MQRALDGLVHSPLAPLVERRAFVDATATLVDDPSGPRFTVEVPARVTEVDGRDAGARVVLLTGTGDVTSPLRVLEAGDRVSVRGTLQPLSGFDERYRWRHAAAELARERARRLRTTVVAARAHGQPSRERRSSPAPTDSRRPSGPCSPASCSATPGRSPTISSTTSATRVSATCSRSAAPTSRSSSRSRAHCSGGSGSATGSSAALDGAGAVRHDDPLGAVGAPSVCDGRGRDDRDVPRSPGARGAHPRACRDRAPRRRPVPRPLGRVPAVVRRRGRDHRRSAARIASTDPRPARDLREALGVTAAAQLGVLPVLLPVFGTVPLVALPANLLAAPVVGPLTVWGLVAGVVGGWPGRASPGSSSSRPTRCSAGSSSSPRTAADHPMAVDGRGLVGLLALACAAAATLRAAKRTTGRLAAMPRYRLGDVVHDLTTRTLVMGILNRTPDSFYDAGVDLRARRPGPAGRGAGRAGRRHPRHRRREGRARARGGGGRGARPGDPVDRGGARPLRRPDLVRHLARFGARRRVRRGRGRRQRHQRVRRPRVPRRSRRSTTPRWSRTHIRLQPRVPDPEPVYDDLVADVRDFLVDRAQRAEDAGLAPEQIVDRRRARPGQDPGDERACSSARARRSPTSATRCCSRPATSATSGTCSASRSTTAGRSRSRRSRIGVAHGCRIVRVHDVAGSADVCRMMQAILERPPGEPVVSSYPGEGRRPGAALARGRRSWSTSCSAARTARWWSRSSRCRPRRGASGDDDESRAPRHPTTARRRSRSSPRSSTRPQSPPFMTSKRIVVVHDYEQLNADEAAPVRRSSSPTRSTPRSSCSWPAAAAPRRASRDALKGAETVGPDSEKTTDVLAAELEAGGPDSCRRTRRAASPPSAWVTTRAASPGSSTCSRPRSARAPTLSCGATSSRTSARRARSRSSSSRTRSRRARSPPRCRSSTGCSPSRAPASRSRCTRSRCSACSAVALPQAAARSTTPRSAPPTDAHAALGGKGSTYPAQKALEASTALGTDGLRRRSTRCTRPTSTSRARARCPRTRCSRCWWRDWPRCTAAAGGPRSAALTAGSSGAQASAAPCSAAFMRREVRRAACVLVDHALGAGLADALLRERRAARRRRRRRSRRPSGRPWSGS